MGFLDFIETVFDYGSRFMEKAENNYNRQLNAAQKSINAELRKNPNSRELREKKAALDHKAEVVSRHRSTDREITHGTSGESKSARSFQHRTNVPLRLAVETANSEPGVYVLYLDGQVMKCGRAAYVQGVHWRLQQYYSLKYDDRARNGDYWSINEENKERVKVSWQCCPRSRCPELEYKLFKKYGKGPWANRAPSSASTNDWELLI